MLTLTAFIANAQPSAIAPRDYQQMLKKGIDVDWWGRSEKIKGASPLWGGNAPGVNKCSLASGHDC